jgi:signal transduction histidine kinase
VEISYEKRLLRLRVRDDGKGIDLKVLDAGARAGHYGLPGMRERAKLAGGKLAVWSKPDEGTEVELTIPGTLAYAESKTARQGTP